MAQQTAPIQSALPQRRFYFDVKWLIIIAIVAFLLVFQVFPLLYMLYKAFFPESTFSLSTFTRLYTYEMNWGALCNTLIAAAATMVLGTVLAVLFILFTLRGRKEDWRIEGVPQKEFSDKELWAAGFAMQKLPVFSMDSAVGKKMMSASAILHPENGGRFVEYWARLYWARTLSMSLLVLALAFCASVFMDGYMVFVVLIAGVAMVAVIYSNGANEMSNQLKKRSEECMMEFSNVVSKLTLLMNCGMILKEAWYIVAKSKKGVIYDLMQEACREMDNGTASAEAIYNFGVRTGSPEVRKFASIIIQNIEKGGSDVTTIMRQQSDELISQRRQMLLRRGDDAAAQLLAPTTIVLVGVIMIIMVAAMTGMSTAI